MNKKMIYTLFSLAFVFSACSPAAAPAPDAMMAKPTDAMMTKPTSAMMDKPSATPDAMMAKPTSAMMDKPSPTPDAMGGNKMDIPAWFNAPLADVVSGKPFTLTDFKGKVVLVEDLAMWCPNCKMQQAQVKAFRETGGMNKDLVFIGLDIDPNENAADLKAYTKNNGFDWIYAVSPVGVSHEIGKSYGDQFLNPPSTPILVIDRKGQVHPMPFGIKSSADLKAFIEPFLSPNM